MHNSSELVKAEQFFKRALEIAEHQLNRKQEHDYDLNYRQGEVASALDNLADFYTKRGNHARAESLYKRALSITKELYAINDDPLSVARAENRLADCYESQGKHSEAEPLYKHAITAEESKCPDNNPDLAAMLHSYASLLCLSGRSCGSAQ
jgi:tetratricopeptide (TPR) repeat protein